MYGNIAVFGNIALSVYKIDYTLRCLEYILFSIFTIKTSQALTMPAHFILKTLTNVL